MVEDEREALEELIGQRAVTGELRREIEADLDLEEARLEG